MKVGIYMTGLGQSFEQVPVMNYADRIVNELNQTRTGVKYETRTEKVMYNSKRDTNIVSVIEKDGIEEKVIYKLYDFRYNDILTDEFNRKNILYKSFVLLLVVVKKFPSMLRRMFFSGGYNKPFQIFYLFGLFLIIGAAILFMIPACITVATEFISTEGVNTFMKNNLGPVVIVLKKIGISSEWAMALSNRFVSLTAIILLIMPQARTVITMLATEFICAHRYLEQGKQRQTIFGDLDELVEYICENEKEAKIHFHTYSFGSIVAIDYLFPFGNIPSDNLVNRVEGLITVGTPFEFIRAYYSIFYNDRNYDLEKNIQWLNVYSIADALGSNFRKDTKIGEAEVGIYEKGIRPVNLNYEIVPIKKYNLFNFLSLYNIKAHNIYWDGTKEGQSCVRLICREMLSKKMF